MSCSLILGALGGGAYLEQGLTWRPYIGTGLTWGELVFKEYASQGIEDFKGNNSLLELSQEANSQYNCCRIG